jgi:hypothetical protein
LLEDSWRGTDNKNMDPSSQVELPGHVENGVIVLDGGALLPEGATVRVSLAGAMHPRPDAGKPVVLPIFRYEGPPDIELTNDDIAEILNREDPSR